MPTSQLNTVASVNYLSDPIEIPPLPEGLLSEIYFGRLYGARSGDKGGCANLGVWAKTDKAYQYLYHYLTVERLKNLLPDTADYKIDRYELPNVKALNFFIYGLLGDGIAATTRTDGQAKSLGEYLRAKLIEVPDSLQPQVTHKQR